VDAYVYAESGTTCVLAFTDSHLKDEVNEEDNAGLLLGLDSLFSSSKSSKGPMRASSSLREHEGLSLKNIAMHVELPGLGITLIGETPTQFSWACGTHWD